MTARKGPRKPRTLAGDLQALQAAVRALQAEFWRATQENIAYLVASIVITAPIIIALVLWTDPK